MPEFLDLHSRISKLLRALVERSVRPYGLYPGQDLVLGVLGIRTAAPRARWPAH